MSAEHLSFDELAELAEGLLARRQAKTAATHLTTCDECRQRADALANTTSALRELGPVTMPADVAARLDRALATAGNAPAGGDVVPDLSEVRRRRQMPPRWLYAAAAAVVLIVGVSVVATSNGSKNNGAGTAADASHPAPLVATNAPHELVQQESGQIYTPSSLATLAPGLVGGGLAASSLASGSAQEPLAAAPPVPSSAKSGAGTNGQGTVSGGASTGTAIQPNRAFASDTAVPAPLRRYAESRQKLLTCAAFITDTQDATPLAVDFAMWANPATHMRPRPALILVFNDPEIASELDVFVVAPACDDSSLLDFQAVAKG